MATTKGEANTKLSAPGLHTSFVTNIIRLSVPYFRSKERMKAFGMVGLLLLLILAGAYLMLLFNSWRGRFFDGLQNYDWAVCMRETGVFSLLAAAFICNQVIQLYIRLSLQISWRRYMTNLFLERYLDYKAYYRMQLGEVLTDNPDQRIADDVGAFVQLCLVIPFAIIDATITFVLFIAILWQLSGPLDFTIGGFHLYVPSYLVWIAFIYAGIGTWVTLKIGAPLVQLDFFQQVVEANYRFSLIRLREQSEGIALYNGENEENLRLSGLFNKIIDNWKQLITARKNLSIWTAFYRQAAIIIPIFSALPQYFAHRVAFGGFQQILGAFGEVQSSLSVIVESYTDIATWQAVTRRLTGFLDALEIIEKQHKKTLAITKKEGRLVAHELQLVLPNGEKLGKAFDFVVTAGESVLVVGPSGIGKSTLLRSLAGIWPYTQGKLVLPSEAALFLPQRPYLPIGTIRQAITYPSEADSFPDQQIIETLKLVGLDNLTGKINDIDAWGHSLSPGEQQKIGFARALLLKPRWLFLDEATSALDEESEQIIYNLLKNSIDGITIISVGHRSSLIKLHERQFDLAIVLGACGR